MIVKNGGTGLRACLASVQSFVDQIVIADTGSTDDTVAIAGEFGALVIPVPWRDHYADARNAALVHVTTDWVLSLDADEELPASSAEALRCLIDRTEPGVGGYRLIIRDYFSEALSGVDGFISRANSDPPERAKEARSYGEHHYCKLFRRHAGIYFSGRIHEDVNLQILSSGHKCLDSDLRIFHYGYLADKEAFQTKAHYYRKLLWMAVKETPNYPHLWIQLAIGEGRCFDNPSLALECAEKAAALNPSENNAWSLIGTIHQQQQRYALALTAFEQITDAGDWGITKAGAIGDLMHNLGRFKEARTFYRHALDRISRTRQPFPIEYSASIESRLGYTEVRMGMHKVGLRKIHHAVDASPKEADNHDRLTKAYVFLQDEHGAANAAEFSLGHIKDEIRYRRAVALRIRLQDIDRARHLLDSGLRLFPQSTALNQMKAELQFTMDQSL